MKSPGVISALKSQRRMKRDRESKSNGLTAEVANGSSRISTNDHSVHKRVRFLALWQLRPIKRLSQLFLFRSIQREKPNVE